MEHIHSLAVKALSYLIPQDGDRPSGTDDEKSKQGDKVGQIKDGIQTAIDGCDEHEDGYSALGHGLSIQRRAALVVALTAHWFDRQRLAVIPMVIMDRRAAAVRAMEVMRALEGAKTDSARNLVVSFALRRPVKVVDGHSGRLKFGPDRAERFRQHLLTSHLPLRLAFDGYSQDRSRLLVAISHVLEMAPGGAALASENLSVLVGEVEEVGSEVHASITSNSELDVNTV